MGGSAEPESEEAPLIQARRTDTWDGLEVDMAETTFEATTTSAFELPTTTEVATTATTSDGAEMRDNRSEDYLSDDYDRLVDPDSERGKKKHQWTGDNKNNNNKNKDNDKNKNNWVEESKNK